MPNVQSWKDKYPVFLVVDTIDFCYEKPFDKNHAHELQLHIFYGKGAKMPWIHPCHKS